MSISVGQWVERNGKRFIVSEINAGVALLRCGFETLRESTQDETTPADAGATIDADEQPQDETTPAEATQDADAEQTQDETPETILRFGCNASVLAKRLGAAVKLAKSAIKPILRCVLVDVDENGNIEFHSTDCDAYRIDSAETCGLFDVAGSGRFVVNAEAFTRALKVCKELTVCEYNNAGQLTLTAGNKTLTVDALFDVDDFPTWDGMSYDHETTLAEYETQNADFARLLSSTVVATDRECNSRFGGLGGVLIAIDAGNCCCVGTDGKRLHFANAGDVDADNEKTGILHSAHASAVVAELKTGAFCRVELLQRQSTQDADETQETTPAVNPSADAIQLGVFDQKGNVVSLFRFRCVEGRYPRWRDVIKTNPAFNVCNVNADKMRTVCAEFKRAKCEKGADIVWPADADEIQLLSVADVGKIENALRVSQTIPTTQRQQRSDDFNLSVDWSFLFDALNSADSENVRLLIDYDDCENRPLIVNADGFSATIMPLSRNERKPPKPETDADETQDADETTPADAETVNA